jgi:DNA (cytosine-5)-methyltransferase 1
LYPQVDFKFPVGIANKQTVKETIGGLGEPEYFARNLDHETFSEHPNHWTMNPRSPKFTTTGALGMKSGTRSFRRLAWDEPSYTVAYGNNEIHVHPDGHRRLSIYEAMLLQGFPKGKDGYRLHGHLSEQVTLVSDAVPPPLYYAVAEKIYETMEWQKRKKKDVT